MTSIKNLRRDCLSFLGVLCLFSLSLPVLFAQEYEFQFNPAQSHVGFTLGSILHTVHGEFHIKSGFIKFDKQTGAASGLIVVDATSGASGSDARDRRMHKEIIESQRYPEIKFVPQHVKGQIVDRQESHLQIDGVLTLHGAEHPVTVEASVNPNGDQLDATTKFDVPYVQWGIKNPSTFILRVSTTVNIDIHGTGRLTETPSR